MSRVNRSQLSQADDPEILVKVDSLCVGYGGPPVVREVSFTLNRGEILCLVGGSGCGKSTLMRAIAGLLQPSSGTIELFGHDTSTARDSIRNDLLKRIGMLFQNGALLGSLSVAENITLAVREHTNLPASVIDRLAELKLGQVGLPGTSGLMPAELSGGMRKRAALCRALMLDPELLLCDEPSAGLDPIVAAGIDTTLRDLQRSLGMTMLVVTHELASIALIADRIVMLSPDGKLLMKGTPAEILAAEDPNVKAFFHRRPVDGLRSHRGKTLLDQLEAD